jgi:hypothetical protein
MPNANLTRTELRRHRRAMMNREDARRVTLFALTMAALIFALAVALQWLGRGGVSP